MRLTPHARRQLDKRKQPPVPITLVMLDDKDKDGWGNSQVPFVHYTHT